MADGHLRDLERRADDDVGSAAELLRGRQRAGQLSADALGVAAALGHDPARAALGEPPARLSSEELFRAAPSWGWAALTRAMLALALEPATARALAQYQSHLYRDALADALAVLEAPADDDARHAAHAAGQVDVPFTYGRWRDSLEGLYALSAVRCAAVRDREDLAWTWSECLHAMLDPGLLGLDPQEDWGLRYTRLGHDRLDTVGERLARAPEFEALLRAGLVAWALNAPLELASSEVHAHFEALRRAGR